MYIVHVLIYSSLLYIYSFHCTCILYSTSIWGGWVNQAYSRLSTTHGHITDCKLDSVVYAGVCVVIFFSLGDATFGNISQVLQ